MSGVPMFTMTVDEARLLGSASTALACSEARGGCLWVCIDDHERTWVIDTQFGRFEFRVIDVHPTTELSTHWWPVSDRVIDFVLACDTETELSLVDRTVVANAADVTAAIDLVPTTSEGASAYLHGFEHEAIAVIGVPRCNTLFAVARCLPAGVAIREMVSPPMWLQFSDGKAGDTGELGVYVDWSDAFDSRSTFRTATEFSEGSVTVPVVPGAFTSFIDMLGDDEVISIAVGTVPGSTDRHLMLGTPDWRFSVGAPDPLIARWASTIDSLCDGDGVTVLEHAGTEWLIGVDDCRVRVELHHGHPDTARVSAIVVNGIETTPDLLRELNELNIASTLLRYCVADDCVRVIVDVPCTQLDRLVESARAAVVAVRRYMDVLAPIAIGGSAAR